jgi:hypothetical protein
MNKTILAAALAAFASAAFAGLPTGLSGAWYDPAAAGHGIHLEMLSPDSAIGAWNVFDAAGKPVHLYLQGRVEDEKLVLQAYAPRGMKFGSFDRSNYSAPRWGLVTLDFADCDHAVMTYDGNGPAGAGYGQGMLPLQRLTRIAGTACSMHVAPTQLPAGAYDGTWGASGVAAGALHAAVDTQGRFWATSAMTPGPQFMGGYPYPTVLTGAPPSSVPSGSESVAVARYNTAATRGDRLLPVPPGGPLLLALRYGLEASGRVTASVNAATPREFSISELAVARAPGANVLDDAGFDSESLAGRRFGFLALGQFSDVSYRVEFGGAGADAAPEHICIAFDAAPAMPCQFSGRITATDEGFAMFDFTLTDTVEPGRTYRGKGWVRHDTGQLVMVAEGGEQGFGFVAGPQH